VCDDSCTNARISTSTAAKANGSIKTPTIQANTKTVRIHPTHCQSILSNPTRTDCAPYHNWRTIYSFSPLANIPLSKHHFVLGGEVHLWAEQTDPSNLDQMLWPRAAAAAEVLWSGSQDADGNGRSQKEAAPRLSEMRERLVSMGVHAEPVQMVYCTMEGGCGA
jgi:N-acetyl-beta-hexosaminidase